MKKLYFLSLAGARVRDAKISDHEPLINHETLSWNIMMPGAYRRNRYNNGFGLSEDSAQYHQRLRYIAKVLGEICYYNPQISVICLQEAPVKDVDIKVFIDACMEHISLIKFRSSFEDAALRSAWGLMTFVDTSRHSYEVLNVTEAQDNLKDRIQRVRLLGENQHTVTNLHLPYESKNQPKAMATVIYLMMVKQLSAYILAGDFNLSFTERDVMNILQNLGEVFAPHENSTELELDQGGLNTLENVDAIIRNDAPIELRVCNLNQTSLLRFTRGHRILRSEEEKLELRLNPSMGTAT